MGNGKEIIAFEIHWSKRVLKWLHFNYIGTIERKS